MAEHFNLHHEISLRVVLNIIFKQTTNVCTQPFGEQFHFFDIGVWTALTYATCTRIGDAWPGMRFHLAATTKYGETKDR
jgi:hypothetical protein